MGNNQSEPSEPFDPDDLSQWELCHLLAIDDAYRARGLEYSVDQTTFRDLLEAPYETTINGIKVPCAAPLPGVGDETFDHLWRMFSFLDAAAETGDGEEGEEGGGGGGGGGGAMVEKVVPCQVLAAVVARARGALCDKVDTLFVLYDMMGTGEMGFDEMVFLAMSALGGMVTLERVGRQPQQEDMRQRLKEYWMAQKVWDYPERSFLRREFQEMVMGMLLENWMKGYGTCQYNDAQAAHGWVNPGDLRYKQLYAEGPVAERDMWASSAAAADAAEAGGGEGADGESMMKNSGMLTNLMVDQSDEAGDGYGEKKKEEVGRKGFLKEMAKVDAAYEEELQRLEEAKSAGFDPHPSVVDKLALPTAGATTGLFEYYYKHFRYYQHGMPENAEDPEAAIDLEDILATFGLAERRVADGRKTLNLTEGQGLNSAEVAHSDALTATKAKFVAEEEAAAKAEAEADEAAKAQAVLDAAAKAERDAKKKKAVEEMDRKERERQDAIRKAAADAE
jgi:hypothetical protein